MMTFDIPMNMEKCAEIIHQIRWVTGITCPRCKSHRIRETGTRHDGTRQYYCSSRRRGFSDIIFEGSHLPIAKWFLAAYLMKFNLSDREIAAELEENTARRIAELIRASAFFRGEEPKT